MVRKKEEKYEREERRQPVFPEPGMRIFSLPSGSPGRGVQLPVLLLPAVYARKEVRREFCLWVECVNVMTIWKLLFI